MKKRAFHTGLVVLLIGFVVSVSSRILSEQRERGDVNGDGVVNILDALQKVNIILGTSPPPSEEDLWAADCNGDGVANVLDALGIVNLILEIGTCVSSCDEMDCDDGNPCTEDYCDSLLVQCQHDSLTSELPCDDGDPCVDVCIVFPLCRHAT